MQSILCWVVGLNPLVFGHVALPPPPGLGASVSCDVNPRPAGVFGRTRPAGGQILLPLPNSRTGGRSEMGEAAIESSR